MNNAISFMAGLIFGAGVGSFAAYKYLDTKYANRADAEIAEYNEYLKSKLDIFKNREQTSEELAKQEKETKRYHEHVSPYQGDEPIQAAPSVVPVRPEKKTEPVDKDDIHIISTDEYLNGTNEKIILKYYDDDDVLTDEWDEMIDDERDVVGDIYKLNFEEGIDGPDTVYVRNPRKEADYEVIRIQQSYYDLVMGPS